MKVLFVCTGNLCRSPMAHAMMRHALAERGCEEIEVTSVGTWAYEGCPATSDAIQTLRKRGIDLSSHLSRAVDVDELRSADVVVAMTSVHVRELMNLAPEVADRIVLLKELREIHALPAAHDAARRERLNALLRGKRPERRRALDVDDPMGLPLSAYERCAGELQEGIDVLAGLLC